MIDDLRHFKKPDAFALLDSETAGALIGAIVAVCLILGWLGVW